MIDIKLLHYLESFLTENRYKRFQEVLSMRTKHFTVAMEDVYHLHNTSAVMRSCDVFGVQELNVIEEINRKRIDREIALGAQKWVDVNRFHSVKDCIDEIKDRGYQIVATSPHQNDTTLDDFDIEKPSCIFFGREVDGLSEEVMEHADCFLKIPMVGFTESLNVSVSAAIIMQHLTSKLRKSSVNWQLSEEEKLNKRLDWVKKTLKNSDKLIEHFYATKSNV